MATTTLSRRLLSERRYNVTNAANLVLENLIIYLDASLAASYPRSGSTITNLGSGGSSYNGTLVNGAAYSAANGGVFTFDGVNDHISVPINLTTGQYTIISTARYTGSLSGRVISSNSNNWLMGWYAGTLNNYFAEGWVINESAATTTNFVTFAGTGNTTSDSWQLYRNGTSLGAANSNGAAGPNGIRLGGSGIYGEYSSCEVGYLLVYDRVLTAGEISQNHNAVKARFLI